MMAPDKVWIKIPIEVRCLHKDEEVLMNVNVYDEEIPSYIASCPKCFHRVYISFSLGEVKVVE